MFPVYVNFAVHMLILSMYIYLVSWFAKKTIQELSVSTIWRTRSSATAERQRVSFTRLSRLTHWHKRARYESGNRL